MARGAAGYPVLGGGGGGLHHHSLHHWPALLPQRIRLYTYEQIPQFLKENPFITDGYRAHLPSKLCLRR
ncbi:unnamed protein product [Merluccius merluccius]